LLTLGLRLAKDRRPRQPRWRKQISLRDQGWTSPRGCRRRVRWTRHL